MHKSSWNARFMQNIPSRTFNLYELLTKKAAKRFHISVTSIRTLRSDFRSIFFWKRKMRTPSKRIVRGCISYWILCIPVAKLSTTLRHLFNRNGLPFFAVNKKEKQWRLESNHVYLWDLFKISHNDYQSHIFSEKYKWDYTFINVFGYFRELLYVTGRY